MTFHDRADAGRRLAAALARYEPRHPVVLALPRGGVPVAAEVAEALGAPLDLVLVRKIGAPVQPELALGAVVDAPEPIVVRNPDLIAATDTSEAEFDAVLKKEVAEIARRRARYLGARPRAAIRDAVVIVVDDGIATGATVKAALRAVRAQGPKTLVLAVPVAPPSTLGELRGEVDDLICLETPDPFGAIGYFYDDFAQVSDETVIDILARFPPRTAPTGGR